MDIRKAIRKAVRKAVEKDAGQISSEGIDK